MYKNIHNNLPVYRCPDAIIPRKPALLSKRSTKKTWYSKSRSTRNRNTNSWRDRARDDASSRRDSFPSTNGYLRYTGGYRDVECNVTVLFKFWCSLRNLTVI